MKQHTIIRLTDRPEYKESMAQWFHEKWGIPKQAYLDSMDACLKGAVSYTHLTLPTNSRV